MRYTLLATTVLLFCGLALGCSAPPDNPSEKGDAATPAADAGIVDEAPKGDPLVEQWRFLVEASTEGVEAGKLSEEDKKVVTELILYTPDRLGNNMTAILTYGPAIEPQILALLEDELPIRRVIGVQIVGRLRLSGAYRKVASMLKDKDNRVRRAAIEVIGQRTDGELVRGLETFMESPSDAARMRSTRYLGLQGDRRILDVLRKRADKEGLVWRLRTLEGLSLLAIPSDYDWFEDQMKKREGKESFNETMAIWGAMAAADPKKTWKALESEKKRRGADFPERDYESALADIAPHVPTEILTARLAEKVGAKNKPMHRNLVRAISVVSDEAALTETTKLLVRGLFVCDIIGARLQREAELERRVTVWEAALSEMPEGKERTAMQASLDGLKADLEALEPLAADAARKLAAKMVSGGKACRGELGVMRRTRVETNIMPLLSAPEVTARLGAATLLARHGEWEDVGALMAILWDEDAGVRKEARHALRKIVGHDMRLPGGFVWELWYARNFGPMPKAHFPVADKAKAASEDYEASLSKRPPARVPTSVKDLIGEPGVPRAPKDTKAQEAGRKINPHPKPLKDGTPQPPPGK